MTQTTQLNPVITQIHYCVPLTEKQWNALNAIDKRGDDRWEEVHRKLEKAGVIDRTIEYNGHFGSNLFFAVERAEELHKVLKAVERLVSKDPDPTPAQTGTPTPETDCAEIRVLIPGATGYDHVVPSERSRRIERSRNALTAVNAELVEALTEIEGGMYPSHLLTMDRLQTAAVSTSALADWRDDCICWMQSRAKQALANAREKGGG